MNKISTFSLENFFENAAKKVIITEDRKNLLVKIAEVAIREYSDQKVVNLCFVCSDNSRTSQLLQVWSFFAAHYFQLNINSFSGGTQVTSFHRNIVKTLQKSGFTFQLSDFSHQNPKYEISFDASKKNILGFSKLLSSPINNVSSFLLITTSDKSDKECPFMPNASYQFNLPFIDLTTFDSAKNKYDFYLDASKQIACEIYFLFNEIRKSLS